MCRSLLLIPLAALLMAADAKEDAIKKDKAALKGKWQLVSLIAATGETFDGDSVPSDAFMIVTDDKITTTLGDKKLYPKSFDPVSASYFWTKMVRGWPTRRRSKSAQAARVT